MGVLCAATFRASVVPSSQARESIVPAALEDAMSGGIKKKERLSREERTALVESFVLRCETHPVSSHAIIECVQICWWKWVAIGGSLQVQYR